MTGKYSACLRVGFLWALTFAVILCTGFVLPVRASGTYGGVAQASETVGEETPSRDAAQAPPNNAMQGPPGAGMGMPPNGPGGPPPMPPGMSSSYSYGPSEVTLEEFLTLTANVILLACGIAFALRYHRGRKSF